MPVPTAKESPLALELAAKLCCSVCRLTRVGMPDTSAAS